MAGSDDERDVIIAPVVQPLPAIPGMSPELLQFFQMQQALNAQAQAAAEKRQNDREKRQERLRQEESERQERLRREDVERQVSDSRAMQKHYEQQMKAMSEQIAKLAEARPQANARPPTIKLPTSTGTRKAFSCGKAGGRTTYARTASTQSSTKTSAKSA